MTPEWENEPEITAYAVRCEIGLGWIVDGARATLPEIEVWLRRSRRGPVEIRQIGESSLYGFPLGGDAVASRLDVRRMSMNVYVCL